MVREFKGVNFAVKNKLLSGTGRLWFNIGIMRRWLKPVLFGLGIVAAGLIATNPKFVLPYKYYLAENKPIVKLDSIEQTAIALPDGFTSNQEVSENEVANIESGTESVNTIKPSSSGSVAGTIKTTSETNVWVAGNLSIPSLKISAPLVYVGDVSEKTFQLGLQQGVVQYPGTALPGQLGNMYVFGHSSDYRWAKGNYKTVLAKLPDIKIGSEIKVTDGAGTVYTYKVTSTAIALPSETKYLSQYNYEKRILTVQTSYPVGTALKRFLAIAELVEN